MSSASDDIISVSVNTVLTHLQRARQWRIPDCQANEPEKLHLEKDDITNDTVHSYYVWRRSTLLTASPIVFISMILGFVNLNGKFEDSVLNAWGKFLLLLQGTDSMFLFFAIAYAISTWSKLGRSILVVRIGWLLSFVMPLLPALFPLEMVIKESVLDLFDDATLVGYKLQFALSYAIALLPVIVTFPGGAVRASLRIRWLLPNSSLAGWILVIAAPFYSVVVCIALVVIMQVAGNSLLFLGALLIVLAPWIYMIRGNLYVGLVTPQVEKQVIMTQRISALVTISGAALVLIWAFATEVSGVKPIGRKSGDDDTVYLLTYKQGIRIVFETLGRLFATTILFTDLILGMTLKNWRDDNLRRAEFGDELDIDFQAFDDAFSLAAEDPEDPPQEPPLRKEPAYVSRCITKSNSYEEDV